MNQSAAVEGSKDHVHLPVNRSEERWHGESKGTVPSPVGSGRKRHSLGTDLEGEYLSWVSPRDRTPRGSESSDEKVGAGNDRLSLLSLVNQNPGDFGTSFGGWLTKGTLYSTGDEEPGHHPERAKEQSWTASPPVHPEDSWDGHGDVNYVLDGCCEKRIFDTSTLHDIYNVVHYMEVSSQL